MPLKSKNTAPSVKDYDVRLKILLIGDSSVGKTSLLLNYADHSFDDSSLRSTIGVDFKVKRLKIDGKCVKMHIWDTAGQEKYQTITRAYYRGADAAIIVYDVSKEESFANIHKWLRLIEDTEPGMKRMLVGNKMDSLERRISSRKGAALAQGFGIPFLETSARSGINVPEVFKRVAELCMESEKKTKPKKRKEEQRKRPRFIQCLLL